MREFPLHFWFLYFSFLVYYAKQSYLITLKFRTHSTWCCSLDLHSYDPLKLSFLQIANIIKNILFSFPLQFAQLACLLVIQLVNPDEVPVRNNNLHCNEQQKASTGNKNKPGLTIIMVVNTSEADEKDMNKRKTG